jgi:flagellar protein FliS
MSTSAQFVETQQQQLEGVTPHGVIALLLDGALERVDQAISRLSDGDIDKAEELISKTLLIVNELRESLNFESGGEIAANLDVLYEYIMDRLNAIGDNEPVVVLDEVRALLSEVYTGWTSIPLDIQNQSN